jgi:hypothetical protein
VIWLPPFDAGVVKARIRELLPAVVVNEVGTFGTVNGTIADELADTVPFPATVTA